MQTLSLWIGLKTFLWMLPGYVVVLVSAFAVLSFAEPTTGTVSEGTAALMTLLPVIGMILMFALTRELPGKNWLRFGLMLFLFAGMPSITVLRIGTFGITQQMLGTLAMIPIALYSGEKKTGSKSLQTAFYLFYPVHLTMLYLIAVS